MSLLDRVIDDASDDTVSTGNLLRKMLILGRRTKADDLVVWATNELNGYPHELENLPTYRGPHLVPVEVYASGYFQSSAKYFVNAEAFPDELDFRRIQFHVWLTQSVAELEHLAESDTDPSQEWSNHAMHVYTQWCNENRAPHMEDYNPISARKIIPRTMLKGVIETVRNRALMFALDLQEDYPAAGEHNGPTTDIPEVRQIMTFNINNNIYGGTNTVASGADITQNVEIKQGDYEGLCQVLKELGLGEQDQSELKEALEEDGGEMGSATKRFMEKLKSGAITVGGAVAKPTTIKAIQLAIAAYLGVPDLS